jgi:hypothetical protein
MRVRAVVLALATLLIAAPAGIRAEILVGFAGALAGQLALGGEQQQHGVELAIGESSCPVSCWPAISPGSTRPRSGACG